MAGKVNVGLTFVALPQPYITNWVVYIPAGTMAYNTMIQWTTSTLQDYDAFTIVVLFTCML